MSLCVCGVQPVFFTALFTLVHVYFGLGKSLLILPLVVSRNFHYNHKVKQITDTRSTIQSHTCILDLDIRFDLTTNNLFICTLQGNS